MKNQMKKFKFVIFIFFVFLVLPNAFGQDPRPEAVRILEEAQRRRERQSARDERNGIDKNGMIAGRDNSPLPIPLYKDRAKERKELKNTFTKTRNLLVVPDIYYEKHKSLLKEKGVELARLQPDKNCYGRLLVSIEEIERCSDVPPIRGGGSLYSFRTKLNYPKTDYIVSIEDDAILINKKPELGFDNKGVWWNIQFINDKFVVENNSVRGIISEVGNVDLANLNSASKELEFLNNFKIKNSEADAKEQNRNLKQGISFNNLTYSNSAPVKMNSTYVLRSINYFSQKFKFSNKPDKSADMTIVFKVVGVENDGSVIILWKELKKGTLKID